MESNQLLAPARILFIPTYGDQKEPRLSGYRHRADRGRVESTASGSGAVVVRFAKEDYIRFQLQLCERSTGVKSVFLFHGKRAVGVDLRPSLGTFGRR